MSTAKDKIQEILDNLKDSIDKAEENLEKAKQELKGNSGQHKPGN